MKGKADGAKHVRAPVPLGILLGMRGLEGDSMRPALEELVPRCVVEIDPEMRRSACFGGRSLPAVDQVDGVRPEQMESIAVTLIGINDCAPAPQAPIAKIDYVAIEARGARDWDGQNATPRAGEARRDLEEHRYVLTAGAVVGIGEHLLSCEPAAVQQLLARAWIDVRSEQTPEALAGVPARKERGSAELRGSWSKRIGIRRWRREHGVRAEPSSHKVVGRPIERRARALAEPFRGRFGRGRDAGEADSGGKRDRAGQP